MAPKQGRRHPIIVSNRLPLSIKQIDGIFKSSFSGGGLVTSLSCLVKSTSFSWYGWPGIEVNNPAEREEVPRSFDEHNAMGIYLIINWRTNTITSFPVHTITPPCNNHS